MSALSTVDYINLALELFCLVLTFSLMLFSLMNTATKNKSDNYFMGMLICNILLLTGDSVTYYLMAPQFIGLQYFGNTLAFFMAYGISAFYFLYVCELINMKGRISPWFAKGGLIISAVGFLSVIVQCFNHMYFYIDEMGRYQNGSFFALNYILEAVICLYFMAVVFINCAKLQFRDFASLLCFGLIPGGGMLLQGDLPQISFGYISITLALVIVYSGLHSDFARRLSEAEESLAQARTSIAISQIQPHFMYNSLSAISQLCTVDPKAAQKMVSDFSIYLRGNLDSIGNTGVIPVSKEMNHVKTYLNLEKVRFEERLNYEFDLQSEDFVVPPLSIQPIVENAVRHGVCKKSGGGTVYISTRELENSYIVVIEDDGVGFDMTAPVEPGTHLGLENVRSRISKLLGGKLEISSEVGKGTTVTIIIPKKNVFSVEEEIL